MNKEADSQRKKGDRHSECRTMAAAQTPQDAAREAAIKGEFGKVYDGRRLRDPLQQLLVAYFAGRQGGGNLLLI